MDTADQSLEGCLDKLCFTLNFVTFTISPRVFSTQAGGDDVECRPILMLLFVPSIQLEMSDVNAA